MYSNSNNMDIMVATVDGIDGPTSKIKYISYFIVNAYTLNNADYIATYKCNYVGYSGSLAMDGSQVPTLLRVTGTIPTPNLHRLYLFANHLLPYHYNPYTAHVYCLTS